MHYARKVFKRRIRITEEMFKNVLDLVEGNVSEFARKTGLPYLLIYNLIHGRIKSVSALNFRRVFGVDPPFQPSQKTDGKYFRGMVRLWLSLNDRVTEKDLYQEFFPKRRSCNVDYRIFSGKTKSVDIRLEQSMEQKFLDQGLERAEINQWIEELDESHDPARVPYETLKPALEYLKNVFQISPTHLLNQSPCRYDAGELRMISREKYESVLEIKKRADKALHSGSRFEIEKLREEISGKRKGMTLFSEIEDELEFLCNCGGKGQKRYLGRSVSYYKKSKLKRIASWRAQKIRADCDELVGNKPDLPVLLLPKRQKKRAVSRLVSSLKSLMVSKIMEDESMVYEKIILTPSYGKMETYKYGDYMNMDETPTFLRMRRKAFDLMVATHSELFRTLAKYHGRWRLPGLFVKDLKEKEGFSIVKEKYEFMAKDDASPSKPVEPEKERGDRPERSSATVPARTDEGDQGAAYFLGGGGQEMSTRPLTGLLLASPDLWSGSREAI
jgi:hypothetical protein